MYVLKCLSSEVGLPFNRWDNICPWTVLPYILFLRQDFCFFYFFFLFSLLLFASAQDEFHLLYSLWGLISSVAPQKALSSAAWLRLESQSKRKDVVFLVQKGNCSV